MAELFTTPIDGSAGSGRRQRETAAATRLAASAFPFHVRLAHHPDGAPYIDGHPDIFISLSHSATTCLLAVSDRPVGVDLESPRSQLAHVARKFLTPEEHRRINLDAPDSLDLLLHYWTAKEAAFKLFRIPSLTVSRILVAADLASASGSGRECRVTYRRIGDELAAIAEYPSGTAY